MKLRDKVAELSPNDIGEDYDGGVCGWPWDYGFLHNHYDLNAINEIFRTSDSPNEKCTRCWDSEYIEDVATKPESKTVGIKEIEAESIEVTHPKELQKILDSGNRREFDSGAVRDVAEGKGRFDLVPLYELGLLLNNNAILHISKFRETADISDLHLAIRAFVADSEMDMGSIMVGVSKHFENGCAKYGERNWEKGIPIHCYVDSGIRHLIKHLSGQTDEAHDWAFVWNMMCCSWTMRNHPGLDDFTYRAEVENADPDR